MNDKNIIDLIDLSIKVKNICLDEQDFDNWYYMDNFAMKLELDAVAIEYLLTVGLIGLFKSGCKLWVPKNKYSSLPPLYSTKSGYFMFSNQDVKKFSEITWSTEIDLDGIQKMINIKAFW